MVVILSVLGIIGLTAAGLVLAKVKELHDWGYSWSYCFFRALGGF